MQLLSFNLMPLSLLLSLSLFPCQLLSCLFPADTADFILKGVKDSSTPFDFLFPHCNCRYKRFISEPTATISSLFFSSFPGKALSYLISRDSTNTFNTRRLLAWKTLELFLSTQFPWTYCVADCGAFCGTAALGIMEDLSRVNHFLDPKNIICSHLFNDFAGGSMVGLFENGTLPSEQISVH